MRCLWLIWLVCLLLICCQSESASSRFPKTQSTLPPRAIRIELDSIKHLLSDAKEIEIRYDHFRKGTTQYEAYPFFPVLEYLIDSLQLDTSSAELIFVCKDGYRATNRIADLVQAGGGHLAFRDLSAPPETKWHPAQATDFPPYYLVWEDLPYEDHSLVWPYGIVSFEINQQDPYHLLAPETADSNILAGFEHYKHACIKCHALNQIGGTLGPDFNQPRNITTYWTRENIASFAQNPQSFRVNSKMYAIKSLSASDLHQVVDYLEFLAKASGTSR
ncbi:MAG: cytochrome c [Bacteroidota bacterium]